MQEQEPSVNDILSSIRQILSNKIDDGNNEEVVANNTNELSAPTVDEQEQALMEATDVYVLMPDMRVAQSETAQPSVSLNAVSQPDISSNDMPYEEPVIVGQERVEPVREIPQSVHSQPTETLALPDIKEADIKPMIQDWLDKNLPALVERVVAEEVRRIFNKR
ncbi:MAG: DUF2497 domain-containing protein [Alphaproteobacteria bacterium]|nr:DUF2497 domain-containing protein [Alphaproteobacteria bacterium]